MPQTGNQSAWADWQPVTGWNPSADVLRETLDGGQSFRWTSVSAPTSVADEDIGDHLFWTGQWLDHLVQLRISRDTLQWRSPSGSDQSTLARYLALDRDWPALTDSLPWRSDPHLARAIAAFPGLRLLRQPFGETLLGFLCSATKQIVQIKQMVALLAHRHGSPLPAPCPLPPAPPSRLPTWEQLAAIPEKDLRACLLGFRARYIHETAKFLATRPGWLDETEALPYAKAKERLLELPGVGEKVADCVLLFGAGQLEAFPVDTWVLKSLARRYGLHGWKPAQVAHFGRTHFGPLAGLAQQYLFSWERQFGGR